MVNEKEQLFTFIDEYRNLLELWNIECLLYSNRVKKAAVCDSTIYHTKKLRELRGKSK